MDVFLLMLDGGDGVEGIFDSVDKAKAHVAARECVFEEDEPETVEWSDPYQNSYGYETWSSEFAIIEKRTVQ